MDKEKFEKLVLKEFPKAVPKRFREKIRNVGFNIELEPSWAVRKEEELEENETLLGLYRGVPLTERGGHYGVGTVEPDVITLFQLPIEEEARATDGDIGRVVRETLWHEVAHHFGLNEVAVSHREKERRHV